jgi:hypothetical protein
MNRDDTVPASGAAAGPGQPAPPEPAPGGSTDSAPGGPPAPTPGGPAAPGPSPPRAFLSWPPPGLEAIQGALLPAAGVVGAGGALLVLPLLVAIGAESGFLSPGPFGSAWWALATTSVLGIVFLLEGFHRLFRILRTGNLAVKEGHGWMTVLQTVTDGARDTGFLLQGARQFTGLAAPARGDLLRLRIFGVGAYMLAALWLLFGFVLGILLSAWGILDPRGLWLITLLPVAVFILAGLYLRAHAALKVTPLLRRTREQAEQETVDQVREWTSKADEAAGSGWIGRGSQHRLLHVRIVGVAAIILGAVILMPLVLFALMGTSVPFMLEETPFYYQGVQDKADLVEPMRPYRLAADPAITPLQAGEALQALNYATTMGPPAEMERDPVRRYGTAWVFGRRSHLRSDLLYGLLAKTTARLTAEERALLDQVAANPAHREFEILARAAAADFAGGLWKLPFPDRLSASEIPIPRFSGISDAARDHLALAAWEVHHGRPAAAETRIREVISTGFLMMDEQPNLIGNLIGIVLIGIGREGLDALYRRTGRTDEADEIATEYERVSRMQKYGRSHYSVPRVVGSVLSDLPRLAVDPGTLRGLRWESLQFSCTVVPFVNLSNAVYGPGEDFDFWLQHVQEVLVRYPSEAEIFRFAKLGMLVSPEAVAHPDLTARLLGLVFGRSRSAASFLQAVEELK